MSAINKSLSPCPVRLDKKNGQGTDSVKLAKDQDPSGAGFLFESVWDHSLDGMRITDEEGLIVRVNKAYCRLVGMAEEDLVGHPFVVVYGEQGLKGDALEKYKDRFRNRGVDQFLQRGVVFASGKKAYVETTNAYVASGNGIPLLLSIFRDVTDRVQAEQAVQQSEKQYHDLFSNAVQGIFQSTPSGKILTANAALLKLLGYESVEELAAIDLGALYVNSQDRKRLAQTLHEKGACPNIELQLRRKDGTIITVLEHSRAVKDCAGNVEAFEGIIEDISERKVLEATVTEYVDALKTSRESLQQLNAQKDKLFSVLSHDLRSPFSSILGFCHILLSEAEEVSPEERREFLGYIRDSAQQQLALVNNLLDWSRMESGRIRMEMREIDLHSIIRSSVTALLGLAHHKDVLLFSNVPKDTMVQGDEQMLGQVFNNLIGNALKFTPAKGVIAVELQEGEGERWRVVVRDTGAGIPKTDLQKLFKVEEKYTRPGLNGELGTGLGLPVVQEIMEKHSGTIEVESVVGEGTTFVLHFNKFYVKSGLNIMIVDDEKGVRAIHGRYVRSIIPAANILYASNAREAMVVAKKHKPNMIISDYAMKDGDGYELLCSLKKDPSTMGIPVVVITGENSLASREALMMSGASEVLAKPVLLDGFRRFLGPWVSVAGDEIEAKSAQEQLQHSVAA